MNVLNENFEAFIQETQGNLNEHNWAEEAFPDVEDYAPGACIRVRHSYEEVEPVLIGGPWSSPINIGTVVSGTAYQTLATFDWAPVMVETFVCDTTTLWINCSFQSSISSGTVNADRYGIQYGLRVDGVILAETVTGSGNRNTDRNGEGIDGDGTQMAFVLDALVPVIAGTHEVELVARMCLGQDMEKPVQYWMVFNREMIILEMH
jgi:hypothetical protein